MRFNVLVNLVMILLLVGCRLPSMVPQGLSKPDLDTSASTAHVLQGRVVTSRHVQADLGDIVPQASIALIDSVTGYTAATTVTDDHGAFAMRFNSGFAPIAGRVYFLDAVKGIKGTGPTTPQNPLYNQAGADAVRLRTVLIYQDSPQGWVSLNNAEPGPIFITRGTTTLSMAVYLKQQSKSLEWSVFVGALHPDTDAYLEVAGKDVTTQEFDEAYTIVNEAITQDRDPLHYLAYDSAVGFVNLYSGYSVSALNPTHGVINQDVSILGEGFSLPGAVTVSFNGTVTAEPTGAHRTDGKLQVKVPVGARTGPVMLQIGTVTQAGPIFTVDSYDGHRAMLRNTLYVANYDQSKIVKVTPDGVVRDFAAVPAGPTQVALYTDYSNPGNPIERLYVACETANAVVSLDLTQAAPTFAPFVTLTKPSGLAFLGNVLFVSSKSLGTVSRFKLDQSSAGAPLAGFVAPTALAFDYESHLFVADGNKVVRVNVTTGASLDWIYLSSPRGLSVDSGGTLYVANYDDSLIYRVMLLPPDNRRIAHVFARIPNPSGIMLDASGYMYATSESQHQIYRISPLGDSKPYAYGISNPRGLAVDGAGNLYVSLGESNAILKIEKSGTYVTRPFISGIPNPHALTWRNNRLYVAHRDAGVISSATAAGSLQTEAVGFVMPGGVDVAADGTLYAGKWGASRDLEVFPPDPAHMHYDRGGLEAYANGAISLTRSYISLNPISQAGLNDGTRWVLTPQNTLLELRATNGPHSTYRYRLLDSYAQTPLHIERDATGTNLYVLLDGSASILRYRYQAGSWIKSTVAGFAAPTRLTFDPTNDRLYVLDGATLKRLNGASGAAPAIDGTWSVGLAGATGISYKNGRVYVTTSNSPWVRTLDTTLAAPVVTNYVEAPVNLSGVYARPQDGNLFVHQGRIGYLIKPDGIVDDLGEQPGLAYAYTPDGTFLTTHYYVPCLFGPTFLPALVQSHEVAVDGNRVYVGTFMEGEYTGVYRFDRDTGEQWFIRGLGSSGAAALAVGPDRKLYVGTSLGKIHEVDGAGLASAAWVTAPAIPSDRLYGLDITAAGDKLWAIGESRAIYGIGVPSKVVEVLKAGLSTPRF
ncbi:Serine/threonine-protein kinase PknD [compost metagenome]